MNTTHQCFSRRPTKVTHLDEHGGELPASCSGIIPAKWAYKAIFGADDQRSGQWGDAVSLVSG
jgi:hypothetical protein